jgi:hypothetical protein
MAVFKLHTCVLTASLLAAAPMWGQALAQAADFQHSVGSAQQFPVSKNDVKLALNQTDSG